MQKSILSFVLFFTSTVFAQAPFIFITVLYNETNSRRMQEYIDCLHYNLEHPLIEKIHIIYDTSKDDNKNKLLRFLQTKDLDITFINGRPTYGYCFSLANVLYPHRTIMVSNADIYFNKTLNKLKNVDLANKFIVLTRWNIGLGGRKRLEYIRRRKPNIWSHDTWIFQTPLIPFEHDDIQIGTAYCDCRIAYQAQKAGLTVLNPCLSIECCHLHQSRVRHHVMPSFNKKETLGVLWTTLE